MLLTCAASGQWKRFNKLVQATWESAQVVHPMVRHWVKGTGASFFHSEFFQLQEPNFICLGECKRLWCDASDQMVQVVCWPASWTKWRSCCEILWLPEGVSAHGRQSPGSFWPHAFPWSLAWPGLRWVSICHLDDIFEGVQSPRSENHKYQFDWFRNETQISCSSPLGICHTVEPALWRKQSAEPGVNGLWTKWRQGWQSQQT